MRKPNLNSNWFLLGLGVLLCLALAMGCSDDSSTGSDGGDTDLGDSLVAVANDSLADLLDEAINQTFNDPDSSVRPGDVDFTGVLEVYTEAVEADPSNKDARFGAAFCGLMTFLADPDLNDLYERFKDISDTGVFGTSRYYPNPGFGRSLEPHGLPLHPSGFDNILIDYLRLDPLMASASMADPTVGDIQDVLETTLLPLIVIAQSHMSVVLADPGFVFYITAAMQGNPGADAIEVDHADFRVIQASLYSLEAIIHIFVARDLDPTSYDIAGLEYMVTRDSDFLSLKPAGVGAGHMAAAKVDILTAENHIVLGLTSLVAELITDPNQDNDLIPIEAADAADINEIIDDLDTYRTYFDGPVLFTPDVGDTITVDIAKFFDTPVNNPKELLPGYTFTIDEIWTDQYEVCYTWTANNYAEWVWPNPTLGGLFPGMTSARIKNEISDEVNEFNWTQEECDIF